jgi:acyl carrier protein
MDIEQAILSYIQSLNFDTTGHDANSRLMQDIGLDSLDFAQVMLHLEDVTGLVVSEERINWMQVQTVGQLAALFEVSK